MQGIISNLLRITLMFFLVSMVFVGNSQQKVENLGAVNVSELSDQQIKRFIEQVEQSGYTESQLEIIARAKGMSESSIALLKKRVNEVQTSQNQLDAIGTFDRMRSDGEDTFSKQALENAKSTTFDPFDYLYTEKNLSSKNELEIFGLSFFENVGAFMANVNVATPTDYLLGPGDELFIDIWGASERSYQVKISAEGSIIIPGIGPIFLNGYSIEKAEARVINRLKSIYSTLGDNTYAQVSLGQLRTITVNVVGEVTHPGSYQASSFANILTVLADAGGPNQNGSFRILSIYRNGKLVSEIDLYDFLIKGNGQLFRLQDQDVIMIKPYLNRISIQGAIKRPAYYEMKTGESIKDAIEFAGGFSENAYIRTISIRRNLSNNRTIKTITNDEFGKFPLIAGDELAIGEIQNVFTKRVRVEGAVNHPGEFEISERMKLSDVIELAEGFRGDTYLERALIVRELENYELLTIPFSPKSVIDGLFDIELLENDLVSVQSIFDLRENYTVTIQGEVRKGGNYPYTKGMVIEDLIFQAGGFRESAAKSFVEVARRNKSNDDKAEELVQLFKLPIDESLNLQEESAGFVLQPFDVIIIRRSPTYEKQSIVEIEGESKYPGKYVLNNRNERISDLIKRSGGLTSYAYVKGATLIRRTEYFVNDKTEDLSDETLVATRIRRESLRNIFKNDTSLDSYDREMKIQESIGIDLRRILEKPGSNEDLILQEGDVISIPGEPQTVRVRGEVLFSNTLKFSESNSFADYVSLSGGYSDAARKSKSYVVYPNGSVQKTKSFLWIKKFPKIDPGSELIVPSKPERNKLNTQEVVGLSSAILSMVLVIDRLTN